jgi:hypothetical protein
MKLNLFDKNGIKMVELISDEIEIKNGQDVLDLMGKCYPLKVDKLVVHEKNLIPNFFDLKTGIAGEILQKFAVYKFPVIIVGDFSKYKSQPLKDFIYESNKGDLINFINVKE